MAQPNAMISAVIMSFSVVKVAFSCAKVIVSWLDQDLYHSEKGGLQGARAYSVRLIGMIASDRYGLEGTAATAPGGIVLCRVSGLAATTAAFTTTATFATAAG